MTIAAIAGVGVAIAGIAAAFLFGGTARFGLIGGSVSFGLVWSAIYPTVRSRIPTIR